MLQPNEDLVSQGIIKGVSIDGTTVRVEVAPASLARTLKDRIRRDIGEAVGALKGPERVEDELNSRVRSSLS